MWELNDDEAERKLEVVVGCYRAERLRETHPIDGAVVPLRGLLYGLVSRARPQLNC